MLVKVADKDVTLTYTIIRKDTKLIETIVLVLYI